MPLRSSHLRLIVLCALPLLVSVRASPQEAPVTRAFTVGDSVTYRVRLMVRSELEGQRTEKIGEVTYAVPLTRSAEFRISWRATRRILETAADGSARVEESLDGFDTSQADPASDTGAVEKQDKETAELAEALRETVKAWGVPRTLRYAESPAGQVRDLELQGGPALGESGFPLLTLWLLRALRPGIALPAQPLRIGNRWEQPRTMQLGNWNEVSAMESGEWLEAQRNPESAVRLHIVQQVSGRIPSSSAARAAANSGAQDESSEFEIRFHAESLNTLSLQDGRLLAATRSASRELVRVLGPVAGLPQPPRFRATLSVQVVIEGCDDGSCSSTGSSGGSSGGESGGGARP